MRTLLLALGANCPGLWGTPHETLVRSVTALKNHGIQTTAMSRLYVTAPVGGPKQAAYLNAVVHASSALPPTKVLATIKRIEWDAGRRTRGRWAPRPLDIDILDDRGMTLGWQRRRDGSFGSHSSHSAPSHPPAAVRHLLLPHPRLHQRAFELDPLLDVAPFWRHPVLGVSGANLMQALGAQRRSVRLAGVQWPLECA